VAWDVTVASTLADIYVGASSTSSAAATEQAAYRKSMKYADLPASFQFQPIAVETLGPINDSATDFLDRLRLMISAKTNEVRESIPAHLHYYSAFQRRAFARNTLMQQRSGPLTSFPDNFVFNFLFFLLTLGIFTTEGLKILIVIISRRTRRRSSQSV